MRALVGRYEGTVIPVALRTNTLYIVKTQKGAFRLLIKVSWNVCRL